MIESNYAKFILHGGFVSQEHESISITYYKASSYGVGCGVGTGLASVVG